MALETSVNESNWILQRDGRRGEVFTSIGQTQTTTITSVVVSQEYKYFAITVSAAQAYMAANPTLDLDLEVIGNMPTACNLVKRTETRTIVSIEYD
jgi:hypothetical protein